MVGEFSELQGIMGREYAKRAGEDPVVAEAVYEHYLPVAAGGDLPATDIGAIVSLADKMDSITGFFAVGVVPTGTADPYALRRQALGIINIMLDRAYPLSLDEMIAQSLSILGEKRQRPLEEVQKDVVEFFRARFENLLLAQGRTYDVVDAVLATGISDLRRTARRIEAMEAFRNHPDYRPLAVAFKRAGNILKGFTGERSIRICSSGRWKRTSTMPCRRSGRGPGPPCGGGRRCSPDGHGSHETTGRRLL
jgi:glycyl-tRNA synthetase beta chain